MMKYRFTDAAMKRLVVCAKANYQEDKGFNLNNGKVNLTSLGDIVQTRIEDEKFIPDV